MKTTLSDTPRTDALATRHAEHSLQFGERERYREMCAHARQLEREIAAALARIRELEQQAAHVRREALVEAEGVCLTVSSIHPPPGEDVAEECAYLIREIYTHPAYAAANPLGGPAQMFDAIAARIRAGEDYHQVLRDYGVRVADGERR